MNTGDTMSYQLTDDGWVGICDECNLPYPAYLVRIFDTEIAGGKGSKENIIKCLKANKPVCVRGIEYTIGRCECKGCRDADRSAYRRSKNNPVGLKKGAIRFKIAGAWVV